MRRFFLVASILAVAAACAPSEDLGEPLNHKTVPAEAETDTSADTGLILP